MLERFQAFVTEYGAIALVVHFAIYGVAIVGFSLAIQMGFGYVGAEFGLDIEESAGTAGSTFAVWGSGWAVAKAIQPLRIALTFILTPIVARFWHPGGGKGPGLGDEGSSASIEGRAGEGQPESKNGSAFLGGEPLESSL